MRFNQIGVGLVLGFLPLSLGGCVGVSVTAQERPFFRALDDFGTRTDLNARLLAEDPMLFANVSTTVVEGRVHLAGTVEKAEQRMRAAQLAWAAPNVIEVINNIEVTNEGGLVDTASDRWISGQVRTRILSDSTIRDSNYSIDTQNRVVYVMGISQNSDELARVVHHAGTVPGVRQVVNYAIAKDDPRRYQAGSTTERSADPNAAYSQSGNFGPQEETPVLSEDVYSGTADGTSGQAMPEPVEVDSIPDASGSSTGPRS